MTEAVSQSQVSEWEKHPVTQRLFEVFSEQIENFKELLASGYLLELEKPMQQHALDMGQKQLAESIINRDIWSNDFNEFERKENNTDGNTSSS